MEEGLREGAEKDAKEVYSLATTNQKKVLGNPVRVFGFTWFHVFSSYIIAKGAGKVSETLDPVSKYLIEGGDTVSEIEAKSKNAKQQPWIEWFTELDPEENEQLKGKPGPGHYKDHKPRSSAQPVQLTPATAAVYDKKAKEAVGRPFERVDIHMRE